MSPLEFSTLGADQNCLQLGTQGGRESQETCSFANPSQLYNESSDCPNQKQEECDVFRRLYDENSGTVCYQKFLDSDFKGGAARS